MKLPSLSTFAISLMPSNRPAALVIAISVVIGLVMVVVFRYTSDQKAIKIAKDQLKAHLLAVRLFQDQLPVVMRAYGRILRGTGRYLRLAGMPLLVVSIPLIYFMVQMDRYLGWMPQQPAQAFLVKVRTTSPDALADIQLQLPSEITPSAPAVHIPEENAVVWRVAADKNGTYDVGVAAAGQTFSKQVVVSSGLDRISTARFRDHFWERLFTSGEPALPSNASIESIEVTYLPRNIDFFGYEWNWIIAFFIISLVAGFIFKSVLGIEI